MKAIRTKFIGPTNTKGSRIKADDGDGNSITVSFDYATNNHHWRAADALARKMGWSGQLIEGVIGDEHVFVWSVADGSSAITVRPNEG